MIKILFFGKLRDALGDGREVPEEQGETVAGLRQRLAHLYPEAANDLLSPGIRACVADMIVREDFVVSGQEQVEFFPPVSGG